MNQPASGALSVPIGDRDHVQGPLDTGRTLVMYGDYECPYTAKARIAIKSLQHEFGEEFCFVFRNFPLTGIHPHAQAAAEAAEAAASQGKFWEMYDLLFEHRHELEAEKLPDYARQLGIDIARFEQELRDHSHLARIAEDVRSGEASGVQGTPWIFINGFQYVGPQTSGALREALSEPGAGAATDA